MLREDRDVRPPLAKRGHAHRDDVQPVEQVLAERALLDHLSQVAVGRGDDADVHLDRLRVADALELTRLNHAQELRLQRRAHRPDFIEEQRAAVRLLDPALAVGDGARERAAHVPEQLAFEQGLGNRAAVDRDEALSAPQAGVVNRLAPPAPLPVPVSPVTSTVLDVAATVFSSSNSSSIIGVRPMMPSRRKRS